MCTKSNIAFKVGDKVKVVCNDHTIIDRKSTAQKTFIGFIKSIFNACDKNGDNWHYEITGPDGWFLYKPNIDGGSITLLKKGHQ